MIKSVLRWSLFFLLVFFLAACGSLPMLQRKPEPVTLKVVIQNLLSFGPYFIAQEEGFFTEQGINVEFVTFQRGSDAIPALVAGQLDVLGGILSFGFLNTITRGAAIRLVADKGSYAVEGCPSIVFVARRALVESGQLKEPAQLKGLRVLTNLNSSRGYNLAEILKQGGLTLDDVTIQDSPESIVVDAFQKNQLDVAVITEPYITIVARSGAGVIWRSADALAPGLTYGIVAYGPSLIEKNPDAGNRFMVGYLKGVRQYRQGKTERNLAIMNKHTTLDLDTLKQACWPAVREGGSIDVKGFAPFQTWALSRGLIDAVVPDDKLWDGRFVEYAKREVK